MRATFLNNTQQSGLVNRREWLGHCGQGLGAFALAELVGEAQGVSTPHRGRFPATAKRVIFLFMSGGFSQFESFSPKPVLVERQGEDLPDSVRAGRPALGMSSQQAHFPLVGSPYAFAQHGQSGAWISSLFPHTAEIVDELAFIHSMHSEAVNHDPALTFLQTGAQLPGRPSLGAWLSYGLGSGSKDLPAYVVMVSKRPVDQPLSSRLWDSGFLPSNHQGVQFRANREPVLYLSNPEGVSHTDTRRMLDALQALEKEQSPRRAKSALASRIEQFELAWRMQSSVPEAANLTEEPDHVRSLYGPDVDTPGSFAANCLQARRLAERGVRFVQLFHPGWDHHGGLCRGFPVGSREVDQPCAGLIRDLRQRGMLKDTLVVFASEFGRTCYSQGRISKVTGDYGREHHRDCFTVWMAGGGIKGGVSYGATDEFGYQIVENPVHVNDFNATILHLLGIDHERLVYPFQGREFRLTDVGGEVVRGVL
jgi:hypothetical protein